MRSFFAALLLSLCVGLPATAHADSFQYTIVNNFDFPKDPPVFLTFNGTYSFTVPSLLTGNTLIYGPGFTGTPFTGFTYVYAADFTVPVGSPVDQIGITYLPLANQYAYTLYGVGATGTSLIQDPNNANLFTVDFGPYGYGSMEITDLGNSQVPEPSTLVLLGTAVLGIAIRVRRSVAHP